MKKKISVVARITAAKRKSLKRFMHRVEIVRAWFKDEELEVSDFVLGRMACRLEEYEKSLIK